MITKAYRCDFKSDIVLPASSNTQGNIEWHDFIPGSNFLGMVAKAYSDFGEIAFDIFHSGKVCFGDGHLMIDKKPTYKIPLAYHNLKVPDPDSDSNYYNRLHLNKDEEAALRKEKKQLKQMRAKYMTEAYRIDEPAYNYTQKSQYDPKLRISKDSGMYGYNALQSGSSWIFTVTYANESLIELIEKELLGEQRLGKSKTTQYGEVFIAPFSEYKTPETFTPQNDLTYLYVKSRLILTDSEGNFTAIPTIENLGLEGGEIDWQKTFIRTSAYTPFNFARETKEYTRVCINKGSVITVKNCKGTLPHRVGAFASEGFGEILVNPKFLEPKHPPLQSFEQDEARKETKAYDQTLIDFLKKRKEDTDRKFNVASEVQKIYQKLIGPSKSQWGEIRAIASIAINRDDLLQRINEYISKGVAKKQWEGKKEFLLKAIKDSQDPIAFTKLLAMIVRKHTKGGKDGK